MEWTDRGVDRQWSGQTVSGLVPLSGECIRVAEDDDSLLVMTVCWSPCLDAATEVRFMVDTERRSASARQRRHNTNIQAQHR